jgi:hypothetical protein
MHHFHQAYLKLMDVSSTHDESIRESKISDSFTTYNNCEGINFFLNISDLQKSSAVLRVNPMV